MRTLDNINKFLVEKLGQKAQPTLLDAFNALSRAYGGEGKARSKEKALEELAIVFVGPAEGVQLKAGPITNYQPKLIGLISFADLRKLDTAAITSMSGMFAGCNALTSLDLSNFNTSQVTNMSSMFANCNALTSLDLSNFDTKAVTNMYKMFAGCNALKTLDLSNFDTSQVTSMYNMFSDCWPLKTLDLSNFDTSQVTNMDRMFHWDHALKTIKWPGEGKWASNASITSFDISNSPLDVDSIKGLAVALATKTTTATLTLKTSAWGAAKAELMPDGTTVEAYITAKGWTVSTSN